MAARPIEQRFRKRFDQIKNNWSNMTFKEIGKYCVCSPVTASRMLKEFNIVKEKDQKKNELEITESDLIAVGNVNFLEFFGLKLIDNYRNKCYENYFNGL